MVGILDKIINGIDDVVCSKCGYTMELCKNNSRKNNKRFLYSHYYFCKFCGKKRFDNEHRYINKNYKYKPRLRKIPKEYSDYLKTGWWIYRKKEYWKNNIKVCYICGAKATEIHHKTYKRLGKEKDKDLIPLCRECHEETHTIIINEDNIDYNNAHNVLRDLKNIGVNYGQFYV